MGTEKMFAKMSESKKKIAKSSKDLVLGKHAVGLIAKTGSISVESLKQSLIQEINVSASSQGTCEPDQDVQRMAAQEALDYLKSLLAHHGG